VPAEVTLVVVLDDGLSVLADLDDDRPLDLADERMSPFDAAVEDADTYAGAARARPRPLGGDRFRPVCADRVRRAGRQAPRRE
jgi:hypothetical protein